MMGGKRAQDLAFHSSDSDDADWTKYLDRDRHLKNCHSSSSSSSSSSRSTSSTQIDSFDESTRTASEEQAASKALKCHPSKRCTVSEPASTKGTLNCKRKYPRAHLPMGNGFRHERVVNNAASDANAGSSEMSWQGKHSDWTHHNPTNHSSTSSSAAQPSGSCQDASGRQSRFHNRPARKNLIITSDSDDDDWTGKTSDNATYRSHSNSPDHEVQQQRSKRSTNNQPRKSKNVYNSRPGKESTNNNNGSSAQPSGGQTSKETGANKVTAHQNHRAKRNAPSASGVSGAPSCSSNEDGNTPGQTTPKNRHMHRLRMHQNRSAGSSGTAYAGSSESETFHNNLAFRRDDPGRRAFSRSGHPLHGRRSRGSPNHHYRQRHPLLQGRESPLSGQVCRNPDLLESESTDDGCELFPTGTNSLTRNNFRLTSPHRWNNLRYQPFGSTSALENTRDNSEDTEDLDIVFLPENGLSPRARNRRRDHGRYSGGRRRQGSRPGHLLSGGDHNILSSSPDPVSQINQLEEDERLARLLQAEFDAEVSYYRDSDLYHSESDIDILIDEEDILSSLSSSSSNPEDSSYAGRHRQHPAQFLFRHQINQGGNSGGSDPPTRGRRRGGRTPTSTPPVVPPRHRHWHGSPVRGRRGRSHSGANSDPLMLPFHWLGLALMRNLDAVEDDYEVLWNLAESMGEVIPRGLQRHEINRLPTHKYQATTGPNHSNTEAGSSSNNNVDRETTTFTEATKECRVCLCDYETNELLRVLPCFHEFHAVCIDKWLKNNNTCPVCRAEVSLDA